MSSTFEESYVVWGIIAVAAFTLLYSIFLRGQFLSWFGIVIPLLGVYLFWRFVRAVERIAAAMER